MANLSSITCPPPFVNEARFGNDGCVYSLLHDTHRYTNSAKLSMAGSALALMPSTLTYDAAYHALLRSGFTQIVSLTIS